MSQRITVGSFELVSLPELGLHNVVAKIDTGAFSGAIHCTDIKLVHRGLKGKRVLKFLPAGDKTLAYETEDFIRRRVRSSTGHRTVRYLIKTDIVIQGVTYVVEIGLSDRTDLKKQVLVGRRLLREQNMLVDVTKNAQYDDEGDIK